MKIFAVKMSYKTNKEFESIKKELKRSKNLSLNGKRKIRVEW